MELNYFAKYSFALSLDDFQGGKETILTAFSTKMKEQERKYNLMALIIINAKWRMMPLL